MTQSSSAADQPKERVWHPDFPIRPRRCPVFYGWVIVCISTLGMCASMPGQTIGVSVFTTRLMEALGLSSMQLSVAYMLGTFLSALLLSWGGRQFDQFGARKAMVRSTVALGLTVIVLASAVGPFLFSAAELFTGSYRAGFIFVAMLASLLAIAALRADNPQRRVEV